MSDQYDDIFKGLNALLADARNKGYIIDEVDEDGETVTLKVRPDGTREQLFPPPAAQPLRRKRSYPIPWSAIYVIIGLSYAIALRLAHPIEYIIYAILWPIIMVTEAAFVIIKLLLGTG